MDKSSSAVTDGTSIATPSTAKMANHQQSGALGAGHTPSSAATGSQASKHSSASNSVTPSPMASRETSPVRPTRRAASANRMNGTRSRKNSQQDLSPTRPGRSNLPTPTSTKSLSSTAIPTLLPNNQESAIQAPTPQKTSIPADLKEGPRWPVSPRLRSPPPQLNKPGTTPSRRAEQEPPAINVQRASPSPNPPESLNSASESDAEDSQVQSGVRTPARGALETVQEVSLPSSPMQKGDTALLDHIKERLETAETQSDSSLREGRRLQTQLNPAAQESGSDSNSVRTDAHRTSSVPPPLVSRQSSAMSMKQTKSTTENLTENMTVETETVSSIPQSANAKTEGGNNTLKSKPSSETIRPKKDKKKTVRKQPPVSAGNASSKADIFEAKIASAVDEANTSDSEETFVYDSNPPEAADRGARRFHSRTPSATSMASQADRPNLRSIYGVMENGAAAPKKNMKFVNSYNGAASEGLTPTEEDGKGTARSNGGSARGTVRHHHHIGRWGRQPGNNHTSLFDNESPFPNAAKPKVGGPASRNSSGPPSPRNHHHSTRGHLHPKRSPVNMSSSYDLDNTTGADDERTPLIGSTRQARLSRHRRAPQNPRQAESQTFTRRSSYLNRFAACLVLTMMLLLVITGAIGFMFATSQPITDIDIVAIKNVVSSEQVLIFDLTVKAHNPNIVPVTVDQANLEIFAKSEHAGTDSDWWQAPLGPPIAGPFQETAKKGKKHTDGDEDSKPNVLLGRITEFDSPLTFEGSLFDKGTSSSTGEMQLAYPGNSTAGGSKRWERIYQDEFDLIVKGVLRYSLPLSAHIRSATVSGRTTVKPNSANDPSNSPNKTSPVDQR